MGHLKKENGHLLRTGAPGAGHLVNRCQYQCETLPAYVDVTVAGLTSRMTDANGTWSFNYGDSFIVFSPGSGATVETCGAEPPILARGSVQITFSTNGTIGIQIVYGKAPTDPAILGIETWNYTLNPGLLCPTGQGSLQVPFLAGRFTQLIQAPYDCLDFISGASVALAFP